MPCAWFSQFSSPRTLLHYVMIFIIFKLFKLLLHCNSFLVIFIQDEWGTALSSRGHILFTKNKCIYIYIIFGIAYGFGFHSGMKINCILMFVFAKLLCIAPYGMRSEWLWRWLRSLFIFLIAMCFWFYYIDFIIYESRIFSFSTGHIKSYILIFNRSYKVILFHFCKFVDTLYM